MFFKFEYSIEINGEPQYLLNSMSGMNAIVSGTELIHSLLEIGEYS